MSWDLLAFDFKGPPVALDNVPGDYQPPHMGHASEIRDRISAHLDVEWTTPVYGIFVSDGFVIEFNLLKDEVLDSFGLRVLGGGDAVAALMQFANPNGWALYDCSTGDFLDPAYPSDEGWRGFQAFRDRALNAESTQE